MPTPPMPIPRNASLPRSATLALALLLAACQPGPRAIGDPQAAPSGDWAVVDIRPGPVGLRDAGEAMARYGHVIRFEPALARSGEDVCPNPVYLASLIVGEHYLYNEFGVRARDLGLYRWQDVRVTQVYCNGKRWRSLGGEVFWVDHDSGYAVRDDALYRLRRLGSEARG